jgi:hypothetical protein
MDLHERLEKLRADATDAAIIRDLATHPEQRILYTRLADHLTRLADDLGLAIKRTAWLPQE